MRAIVFCAVFGALLIARAHASAYSDFNKAISARTDDNNGETVRLMSLALSEPGLSDNLRPTAFLVRGEAYVELKESDLALADLTESLRLFPGNYIGLVERGDLHFRRDELDLARADYIAARQLRPEQWRPYADLGQLNVREGKYDDALKDYDAGFEAMPDVLDFYVIRSQAYRLSGQYEKALDEAESAIERNRKYAEAYLARALAEDDSGTTEAAMGDYDKAHDGDPDDTDIALHRGIALWKLGRYADASESFRHGTDAYSLIWRYLANAKLGEHGTKSMDDAAKYTDTAWPAPIVQLFAGTAQPDSVLAAAASKTGFDRIAKTCDANFYVGEWRILKGDTAAGKPLLEAAANSCPIGYSERGAAKVELGRFP